MKTTSESIQNIFSKQTSFRWQAAGASIAQRKAWLLQLKKEILNSQDELKNALWQDFKKPALEVELTEITPVILELEHIISHLDEWLSERPVQTPYYLMPATSKIVVEPKGQTLILSPWNYPFTLSMAPLMASVAAGNTIILRPSEKTMHTSKYMQSLLAKVFKPEHVTAILGEIEVAQTLTSLAFDHIFFTGSPVVGKKVMAAAAGHLSSVTLELGGKSPAVVGPDANIKNTVATLVWGKYLNAGQTCIAPDFALVPNKIKASFLAELQSFAQRLKKEEMSRLIDRQSFSRIKKTFDASGLLGEKIIFGGDHIESENYFSFTAVEATWQSPWMKEEIFAPILPIIFYDEIKSELAQLRSQAKPLAMYYFGTEDRDFLIKHCTAGTWVTDNVAIQFGNINLPFGGIGNSGFGSSHGHAGFKCFVHEKSVMHQGPFSLSSIFFPPYDRKGIIWGRKFLKFLRGG